MSIVCSYIVTQKRSHFCATNFYYFTNQCIKYYLETPMMRFETRALSLFFSLSFFKTTEEIINTWNTEDTAAGLVCIMSSSLYFPTYFCCFHFCSLWGAVSPRKEKATCYKSRIGCAFTCHWKNFKNFRIIFNYISHLGQQKVSDLD